MSDINKTIIVGRLTRDAELSYTSSGTALARLGIAVNRRVKQGDSWIDEANFFDAKMWGKRAEAISQYLTRGTQVCIEGELRQERWEKDGQKHSKVTINVNEIQLLGGKKQSEPEYSPKTDPKHNGGGGQAFSDDIPFSMDY